MKKWTILFCSIVTFTNCSNNTKDQRPVSSGDSTSQATGPFFPVTSFLKGQLRALDSLPVTILQVTTVNNHPDSSWISKEKIKPLLEPFTADLIDKENLTAFFKEKNFNDQSTEAITFTYEPTTALPESIALRHWDVYVDPEKSTVKMVYIVKQLKENGKLFTQQLTWQTDKWAKIVTINNETGSIQSDIKWVWWFNE